MTDVGEIIDARPVGAFHIGLMCLCSMILLFDGYDLQVMSLAVPSVAEAWNAPPSRFGFALSASLIGMGVGAALLAPLGDRLGRKPLVVGGMIIAGGGTLVTAMADSFDHFALWRFVTGIGMGALIANVTALLTEYMPARKRTILVTLSYSAVALGGFFAGLVAPALLKVSDWRGLFVFGGATSLAAAAVFALAAPESLKFLVAKRPGSPALTRVLRRFAPGVGAEGLTISADSVRKGRIVDLLSRELRPRTLTLWGIYVFNIFVIFMLTSWLPTLLRSAGWPTDQALTGAVLFQLGGVAGSVALASQVDRGRPNVALIIGYLLCAAGLAGLIFTPSTFGNWAGLMLLVGFGISGAQSLLVALAAAFYPVTLRAAGVGGALLVGRVGAISAPLLGGVIIQHYSPVGVLGLMIIPALICAAGSMLVRKGWLER
jgi:AAHS family 4-hydroxybenzoate transporter-like MFS transporter